MPSAHRRPGALSEQLAQQLATVEPSYDGHMVYRPCRVTVDDGSIHDRVYVVEASPYKQMWGVWPENDPAKVSIAVERLAKIEASPSRLPAGLATKLYES